MTFRIACQMDPIDRIDIRGDSTFALLLEAARRDHALFVYRPEALTLDEGRLVATGQDVTVRDVIGDHVTVGPDRRVDLADMAVVLLRQDPPFDMAYLTTTYLLERLPASTLVVNNPREVRNAPEKIWVLDFQDLMPPTLVARSVADVQAFRARHKDIVVKPLYGNGGAAVFRLRPDDSNLGALMEVFHERNREPVMVQEFRPEVRHGDKRIILVDGEPAGAINRVPADGETRSNMHVGGTPKPTDLTPRDLEICRRLGPELKRRGLIFVGIDVIGPYLTEINVTSPTGIRQVKAFGGADIASLIWDAIEMRKRSM